MNTFLIGSYGGTWLGLYTPVVSGVQFQIQLDSPNLVDHITANNYTFSNVVQSTAAHEFGHGLSLAHNDLSYSLMSHARNRNVVTTPHSHDVSNVNAYY